MQGTTQYYLKIYFISPKALKQQFFKMADAGNIYDPESLLLFLLLQENSHGKFENYGLSHANRFILKQKSETIRGFFKTFKKMFE